MKKLAKSAFLFVPTVHAQTVDLSPTGQFSVLGDFTLSQLISAFVQLLIVVAAVVFFFILVVGGIRWIVSGGDKAQTEAARSQITAGLIGLVIVFSAWAILAAIDVFFGIDILGGLSIPCITGC